MCESSEPQIPEKSSELHMATQAASGSAGSIKSSMVDTGSSLTRVEASVADLSSKFICLEQMVRGMSQHVMSVNDDKQWDIQSVTSFSDKESETNSLDISFGDFK